MGAICSSSDTLEFNSQRPPLPTWTITRDYGYNSLKALEWQSPTFATWPGWGGGELDHVSGKLMRAAQLAQAAGQHVHACGHSLHKPGSK